MCFVQFTRTRVETTQTPFMLYMYSHKYIIYSSVLLFLLRLLQLFTSTHLLLIYICRRFCVPLLAARRNLFEGAACDNTEKHLTHKSTTTRTAKNGLILLLLAIVSPSVIPRIALVESYRVCIWMSVWLDGRQLLWRGRVGLKHGVTSAGAPAP